MGYPPFIVYASSILFRIKSCSESDILLDLSASVRRFALMRFICIQSGLKRGYVELTVLSDFLEGTLRVLEAL